MSLLFGFRAADDSHEHKNQNRLLMATCPPLTFSYPSHQPPNIVINCCFTDDTQSLQQIIQSRKSPNKHEWLQQVTQNNKQQQQSKDHITLAIHHNGLDIQHTLADPWLQLTTPPLFHESPNNTSITSSYMDWYFTGLKHMIATDTRGSVSATSQSTPVIMCTLDNIPIQGDVPITSNPDDTPHVSSNTPSMRFPDLVSFPPPSPSPAHPPSKAFVSYRSIASPLAQFQIDAPNTHQQPTVTIIQSHGTNNQDVMSQWIRSAYEHFLRNPHHHYNKITQPTNPILISLDVTPKNNLKRVTSDGNYHTPTPKPSMTITSHLDDDSFTQSYKFDITGLLYSPLEHIAPLSTTSSSSSTSRQPKHTFAISPIIQQSGKFVIRKNHQQQDFAILRIHDESNIEGLRSSVLQISSFKYSSNFITMTANNEPNRFISSYLMSLLPPSTTVTSPNDPPIIPHISLTIAVNGLTYVYRFLRARVTNMIEPVSSTQPLFIKFSFTSLVQLIETL